MEYEQALRRFKKDVNLKRIKSVRQFFDEVNAWSGLNRRSSDKLAGTFKDMLRPPKKEPRLRREAKAELIPRKTERVQKWDKAELALLRREKAKGRGWAKRFAVQTGRSQKAAYMKLYWMRRGK